MYFQGGNQMIKIMSELDFERLNYIQLLSIIFGVKIDCAVVKELSETYETPRQLLNASYEELKSIKGISVSRASKIRAMSHLGKRLCEIINELPTIKEPSDVYALVAGELQYLEKECFKVLMLTTKNKVLKIETVAIGTLNSCLAHPREIYKSAIRICASAVIVVHNHPSGDPTPSPEDIAITKRLTETGKIIGIELLDHIIVGDKDYCSFKEKSLL